MKKPYIELNAFLKIKKFAATGGQAKLIIRDAKVKVNGAVETRNKKKLYAGDTVEIGKKIFKIEKELTRD